MKQTFLIAVPSHLYINFAQKKKKATDKVFRKDYHRQITMSGITEASYLFRVEAETILL